MTKQKSRQWSQANRMTLEEFQRNMQDSLEVMMCSDEPGMNSKLFFSHLDGCIVCWPDYFNNSEKADFSLLGYVEIYPDYFPDAVTERLVDSFYASGKQVEDTSVEEVRELLYPREAAERDYQIYCDVFDGNERRQALTVTALQDMKREIDEELDRFDAGEDVSIDFGTSSFAVALSHEKSDGEEMVRLNVRLMERSVTRWFPARVKRSVYLECKMVINMMLLTAAMEVKALMTRRKH